MENNFWTPNQPQPRERYDAIEDLGPHSLEFKRIREQRFREFTSALAEYVGQIAEQRRAGNDNTYVAAQYGQKLGEAFVRQHHVNVLQNADPTYLRQFQNRIIKSANSRQEGLAMLSGCLSQFGAYEAIKEAITSGDDPLLENSEMYYPLPAEDLLSGTDMYLTVEDIVYAIQLKTFPVLQAFNPVLQAFNPALRFDQQFEEMLTPLLTNLQTSDRNAERIHNMVERSTRHSLKNLIISSGGYSNVIPLFMTMASPTNVDVTDLDNSGMPKTEELATKICKKMQEIHSIKNKLLSNENEVR